MRKTRIVNAKVSEDEKKILATVAEIRGTSVSEIIRQSAMAEVERWLAEQNSSDRNADDG